MCWASRFVVGDKRRSSTQPTSPPATLLDRIKGKTTYTGKDPFCQHSSSVRACIPVFAPSSHHPPYSLASLVAFESYTQKKNFFFFGALRLSDSAVEKCQRRFTSITTGYFLLANHDVELTCVRGIGVLDWEEETAWLIG